MTIQDLGSKDVDALLAAYSAAAELHGLSSTTGDPRKAIEQYEVLAASCRELRKRGIEAQRRLEELLDHKTPYVRLWAACHCLEFSSVKAERVLEHLVKGGGVSGFTAEMTLQEWRKGTLKFP